MGYFIALWGMIRGNPSRNSDVFPATFTHSIGRLSVVLKIQDFPLTMIFKIAIKRRF